MPPHMLVLWTSQPGIHSFCKLFQSHIRPPLEPVRDCHNFANAILVWKHGYVILFFFNRNHRCEAFLCPHSCLCGILNLYVQFIFIYTLFAAIQLLSLSLQKPRAWAPSKQQWQKKKKEKSCPPWPPTDGQQGKGGGEGMITEALLLFTRMYLLNHMCEHFEKSFSVTCYTVAIFTTTTSPFWLLLFI